MHASFRTARTGGRTLRRDPVMPHDWCTRRQTVGPGRSRRHGCGRLGRAGDFDGGLEASGHVGRSSSSCASQHRRVRPTGGHGDGPIRRRCRELGQRHGGRTHRRRGRAVRFALHAAALPRSSASPSPNCGPRFAKQCTRSTLRGRARQAQHMVRAASQADELVCTVGEAEADGHFTTSNIVPADAELSIPVAAACPQRCRETAGRSAFLAVVHGRGEQCETRPTTGTADDFAIQTVDPHWTSSVI
mmetsp:Transcript_156096/g.500651  ORF Transcript_156096/g.500651 Transcript_156096/m.500651 type:complete len:246 (+) Transcript_156096:3631-4368(+)